MRSRAEVWSQTFCKNSRIWNSVQKRNRSKKVAFVAKWIGFIGRKSCKCSLLRHAKRLGSFYFSCSVENDMKLGNHGLNEWKRCLHLLSALFHQSWQHAAFTGQRCWHQSRNYLDLFMLNSAKSWKEAYCFLVIDVAVEALAVTGQFWNLLRRRNVSACALAAIASSSFIVCFVIFDRGGIDAIFSRTVVEGITS